MARVKDSNGGKKAVKKVRTLDSFKTVTPVSPEESAAALAVLNSATLTKTSRPKRNASKRASKSIGESIDPTVESADEGEEFVPDGEEADDVDDVETGNYESGVEDLTEQNALEATQDLEKAQTSAPKKRTAKRAASGGAKRGRKPKKSTPVQTDIQSPTPTSKLDNKRRVIRALKDLTSARDKIERIYGLNTQKLLGLAKVKECFETGSFDFDIETIQPHSKYYVDFSSPCSQKDVTQCLTLVTSDYRVINESEMRQLFPLNEAEVPLQISELDTHIKANQSIEFPVFPCGKRKGFVFSTGGLVTDIAWLPRDDLDHLYLAVSVSNKIDEPVHEDLRCWGEQKHTSCIKIFALDPKTLVFETYQTIIHPFGETWNLKWHSGFKDENSLGLLAACCQDGSVKFMKIDRTTENEIKVYENASISVALSQTPISCFDFTSSQTIVCGFQNGYVAEFELGSNVPSYYRQVHDSYVISIVTAYSGFEDKVITTTSVDGFICVYNPLSIQTTKCSLGRVRGGNSTIASYCPPVYGVVHTDGVNSIKAFTPKAAFASHQICQHENTVSALATSKLHPFLLSGSADGTLIINNLARRFLTGIKNNASVHKFLKLWEWNYNIEEKKYRLDPNYEVFNFSVNEVSKARVNPHGVNISSVKWNETCKGGKFYAFANNAGLLVIEELGS
ncbi:LAME_0D02696g1_1 [Lachancea meyersii CBS 8951]|uniref:LAME_0D02696g1_1 n=1 Tax=Lachancea meyersii CBS 8951 TaxID=1266667 RepID=A0A1G4J7M8_9SACH|nr:LAME_0D02696g1_1 [Lachancea meyersii CBS 8951]